jgi:signal transduction histidine kinase
MSAPEVIPQDDPPRERWPYRDRVSTTHGRAAADQQLGVHLLAAAVLGGLALVEIWVQPIFQTGIPGPRPALTALVVLMAVALAIAGRWPLVGAACYVLVLVAISWVGDRDQSAFELALACLLVAYTLAKVESGARAGLGAAVLAAGFIASTLMTYGDADGPVDVVVPAVLFAAAWSVGREVRHHREQAVAVADAEVAGERIRIARELHDVVAHGVSVMGLQAAGARASLPPDLAAQRHTMQEIEAQGRRTLDELHRMLGVLRSDADAAAPLEPMPRLDQLAALCADDGIPPRVCLELVGTPRPLPAGTELAAYRIVQEGLTNARRHADAQHVRVRLTYHPDKLDIDVQDDGRGAPADVRPGHGLIGIRERVALHGGSFRTDTSVTGFRLRASLPAGSVA